MYNIKRILKNSLTYIVSKKILQSIIIFIIIVLPAGNILINKLSGNKAVVQEEVSDSKDKKKDIAKGTIKTDAVKAPETSTYNLSDGYTEASNQKGLGNSSSINKVNSSSSETVNTDKSSLSGINLEILEGYEFNPKKDLKLQATDKNGSNISDNIIIEKNTVNTKTPGIYTVRASIKLSDGQRKEKEFTVTVKETILDVSLASFKSLKENVKKGETIVFNIDLKVSKNHITPTMVMINGKEYSLYKGEENIFDKLSNKKRYKANVNGSDVSGVHEYNLEHVKMSDGRWINLGKNISTVEVLKQEATIKNFAYEENSSYKRISVKFDVEDMENTASNLKFEFYKGDKLIESKSLDKKSSYDMYLSTDSNGKYDFKILADINLNKDNTISNKEIFKTSISVSNVNQSSLTGNNIELIQGDEFDAVKDLSLKATDFDGEDITDKIVINSKDIDTNVLGKHKVSASVVNKKGRTYNNEFNVIVKPVAKVIEFSPTKDEFYLDESISFEVKLQMEKDNIEADKAVINGQEVSLVPNNFRNILSNTKTYLASLSKESSNGNKKYSLSKIIMKDGKEFNLNEVSNVDVLETIKEDSQDKPSLFRMLPNNKKENKSILKSSNVNDTISGNETETLIQNVTINGTVKSADGSVPSGRIEVEMPTKMAFSVDQDGNLQSGSYTVSNKSSVGITVSVVAFSDSNPNGGITIKPKSESLSGADRSNLHLDLVGDKNTVDLGQTITNPIELMDVNPLGVGIIQLNGKSGLGDNTLVDEKGVSDKFSLVFSIKKKN